VSIVPSGRRPWPTATKTSEGHVIVQHLAGFLRRADVWVEAQRAGDPNVAGLTAAEPARPRVGAVTRQAAGQLPREPWVGKRARAKADLRYDGQPGWHPQHTAAGPLAAGTLFDGGVIQHREVGDGHQYEVFTRSATKRFWITASPRFVDLID
jgi:hypothetical protein